MIPKILVVANSPFHLGLMSDLLEANEVRTERAASVAEAIRRIPAFRPGLVVMDMDLPVQEASRLIGWLRVDPEARDLPVVAVAPRDRRPAAQSLLDFAFAGWVEKPIDTCSFSRRVLQHMRRSLAAISG